MDNTISDVIESMNDEQRSLLYGLLNMALGPQTSNETKVTHSDVKEESTSQDILDSMNNEQRLVLDYLVSKALTDEEDLTHYGILGMKWGKRKSTTTKATINKSRSKSQNEPRRMSNKELNARIKRLRLEDEYNRLNKQTQKVKPSDIERIVKGIGTVATVTGTALTLHKNIKELASLAVKVNSTIKKVSGK